MKISVCMATYNGEHFIRPQLDSILKQLSPTDELIVSDDSSTDSTLEIIKSYKDPRIKLLHSTHRNLILNFENALNSSVGDVIFLADQDDVWFDDKVEIYKEHLAKNLLVFSNAAMFKGDDLGSYELFFKDSKKKTGLWNNLAKVKFLGATLAFQRKVLECALPFPKNIAMHDIWIGLVAESLGKTHYLHQPYIYYRRHENTASTAGAKSSNSLFTKLKIRIDLLLSLIQRSIKVSGKSIS